jgi:hypothetical protein
MNANYSITLYSLQLLIGCRYSTISVRMFFHRGTMHVKSSDGKRVSHGFRAYMTYTDGHGSGVAPHTGKWGLPL